MIPVDRFHLYIFFSSTLSSHQHQSTPTTFLHYSRWMEDGISFWRTLAQNIEGDDLSASSQAQRWPGRWKTPLSTWPRLLKNLGITLFCRFPGIIVFSFWTRARNETGSKLSDNSLKCLEFLDRNWASWIVGQVYLFPIDQIKRALLDKTRPRVSFSSLQRLRHSFSFEAVGDK